MDIRKLQRAIVDGLEDVKAQDIVVFNTEHLSPLFERVVIASGTSNRQTKALASSVREQVKAQGGKVLSTEGSDTGEWIIVDCGAAVVHIMQPAIRTYYQLEEIWGEKPVKLKLGSEAPRGLPKASAPEDDAEEAAPKKRPARKLSTPPTLAQQVAAKQASRQRAAAPENAPAKKKAAGKTTAAGKKTAAGKTVARKAPAKKAAVKTVVVKRSGGLVSRSEAKKVVAKKAPARKTTAAKKSAPRKVAVKTGPRKAAATKKTAARKA
jgi:ribosome-associated protein